VIDIIFIPRPYRYRTVSAVNTSKAYLSLLIDSFIHI